MLPKDGFFYPESATQRDLLLTLATEVKKKEKEKNAEIAWWIKGTTNGVVGVTGVTGVTGAIGAIKANNATDTILPPIHPPVLSLNPSEFARRLN